jgi:spore coat polysaccharide biosynthesis protein SpsF (cytidylyltransferase family)
MRKHGGCKTKFKPGRYMSSTPVSAAKKAFNQHCNAKSIRGACVLVVAVKETTRGSLNKTFTYEVHRKKLEKPVILLKNTPNEFKVHYKTSAKSLKKNINKLKCKTPGQTRGVMKSM